MLRVPSDQHPVGDGGGDGDLVVGLDGDEELAPRAPASDVLGPDGWGW